MDKDGWAIRDPDSTTYVGAIETAEEFCFGIYTEAWRRGWEWATIKVVRRLAPLTGPARVLARSGGKVVLVNR